jgi:hypothetical protein
MSLADKQRRAIPEPVVVNDAFVTRFFAGVNPIGQQFCIDPTNKTYWYEIVGVVKDTKYFGLREGVESMIYISSWRQGAGCAVRGSQRRRPY